MPAYRQNRLDVFGAISPQLDAPTRSRVITSVKRKSRPGGTSEHSQSWSRFIEKNTVNDALWERVWECVEYQHMREISNRIVKVISARSLPMPTGHSSSVIRKIVRDLELPLHFHLVERMSRCPLIIDALLPIIAPSDPQALRRYHKTWMRITMLSIMHKIIKKQNRAGIIEGDNIFPSPASSAYSIVTFLFHALLFTALSTPCGNQYVLAKKDECFVQLILDSHMQLPRDVDFVEFRRCFQTTFTSPQATVQNVFHTPSVPSKMNLSPIPKLDLSRINASPVIDEQELHEMLSPYPEVDYVEDDPYLLDRLNDHEGLSVTRTVDRRHMMDASDSLLWEGSVFSHSVSPKLKRPMDRTPARRSETALHYEFTTIDSKPSVPRLVPQEVQEWADILHKSVGRLANDFGRDVELCMKELGSPISLLSPAKSINTIHD